MRRSRTGRSNASQADRSASSGRPTVRSAGTFVLLAVLAAVVLGYFVFARQVTAVPRDSPFDGWVVVLADSAGGFQADSAGGSGQVALRVRAKVPGAPGPHPAVWIGLSACNMASRELLLLLAGDARLEGLNMVFADRDVDVETDEYAGLVVSTVSGFSSVRTDVVALRLKLGATPECAEGLPALNVVLQLEGRLQAPVRHQASLFGVEAPRHVQVWPAIGSPSGISSQDRGFFTIESIGGLWERPQAEFSLNVGEPSLSLLVESSTPELADPPDLAWSSPSPFSARAALLDMRTLSSLQTATTFAAILFGLVGSAAAGVFVERFHARRPIPYHQPAQASQDSTLKEARRGERRHASAGERWSIAAAIVLVWVLARRTRR